ncbi:MAG: hypothetical protein AAFX39_16975 [Pseudomonadota bacterium]
MAGVRPRTLQRFERQPSAKNTRALLQQVLLGSPDKSVALSEGAAQMLAEHAAQRMLKTHSSKSKRIEQVEASPETVSKLLDALSQETDKPKVTVREVRPLMAERRFCGIEPWC